MAQVRHLIDNKTYGQLQRIKRHLVEDTEHRTAAEAAALIHKGGKR